MRTEEIVKLTRKRVSGILEARRKAQHASEPEHDSPDTERRKHPRWPFKGAVELWPEGAERGMSISGTCVNLSETGIGVRCDEHLEPGSDMEVAVHLPEMTLCGQATVRYCAEVRTRYMVGLEFAY